MEYVKKNHTHQNYEILKLEKCSFNYFGILAICVSGDSSSIVSVICYTVPKSAMGSSLYALESGSDFKSRGMSAESRGSSNEYSRLISRAEFKSQLCFLTCV